MLRMKLCWRAVVSLVLLLLSRIIKRDKNWIAFGAWCGELYIDNSRYLFETALSIYGNEYKFVWIGNDQIKRQLPNGNNVICCKKNSIQSLHYLLKCKYMFCSQMHYEDLSNYNVFYRATITYLHHGCPVKKWGDDAFGESERTVRLIERITGKRILLDYFVCSSEKQFKTNLSALKSWGCTNRNNLRTGTPRNDILINKNSSYFIMKYKEKYAKILGFSLDRRVILYAPTFRRSGVKNESLVYRDYTQLIELNDLLNKYNCVIIEKAHYAGEFATVNKYQHYESIISCPKDVNIQEMLLFTDCLISDYSGVLLDYSILNRPIIHYIYDLDYYRDFDSGLYYEFSEFQAGEAVKTFEELITAIQKYLEDPSIDEALRKKVKQKFMEYEQGNASEQILRKIIS